MNYGTLANAWAAVSNSGVVDWDWGTDDPLETLGQLARYVYLNGGTVNDSLHGFIVSIGQDPQDYDLWPNGLIES